MSDESRTSTTGAMPRASTPFETVVVPHLAVLLRVARSLTADPHDAEDLVQDTLVRALRSLATFDGAHPRAWLLTIMRNANVNRHRRRRPGLLPGRDDLSGEADRRNPAAPAAEDVALAGARWLDDALGRLPPRHRRVVHLVDVAGLTYDEAAAVLGVPVGTVMSRLHRARRRLRADLGPHLDHRSDHR